MHPPLVGAADAGAVKLVGNVYDTTHIHFVFK